MDGDGDLDIVMVNTTVTGFINRVARNDGAGNFTSLSFGGVSVTSTAAVGDIDGDGDLDVVVAESGEKTAYFNPGNGNLPGSGTNFGIAGGANDLVFGDVDGDGDLDVAVGLTGANAVYLNEGSGNFTAGSKSFGTGSDQTQGVDLGDVDGDGDLDVAVGNVAQQNEVYLNDGSGNFTAGIRNFDGWNTSAIEFGDVDGDGDLDLAVGNSGELNLVCLNDGSGNFTSSFIIGIESVLTTSVALADVDGDGDLDYGLGAGQNAVYLNATARVFSPVEMALNAGRSSDITVTYPETMPSAGTTATLPVRGLFSARRAGTYSGAGTTTLSFNPTDDFEPGELIEITLTDALLSSSGFSNIERTYRFRAAAGAGPASFATTSENFATAGGVTFAIAAGDVNGDGHVDLATGNNGGQNRIDLNDGVGNFSFGSNVGTVTDATRAIAFGDVDNDGDLDLAIGNNGATNTISINTAGTFGASGNFGLSDGETQSMEFGDLDNDGDVDIVVGNGGNGGGPGPKNNFVYFNNGSGGFGTSESIGTTTDNTYAVALGDVDGDGDLDIALGNLSEQNQIILNDADGTFTTGANFGPTNDKTWAVVFGDVDGDGDQDMAVGNDGEQNTICINDGTGNFTLGQNVGSATSDTYDLSFDDLDGDGDLDLSVANENQPNTFHLNDGAGNFAADVNFGTGSDASFALAIADFDGDLDLDIAVGNNAEQNVVYLNNSGVTITETTAAAGLSGTASIVTGSEARIFGIGLTGDGVASVNSVSLTISDLSTPSGLASGDFTELRLYRSTDATLDGGDTQIESQTSINIGSSTSISATVADVPANGVETFYLVSAVIASGATGSHAFKVGFAANGVGTTAGPKGSAVAASDADNLSIIDLLPPDLVTYNGTIETDATPTLDWSDVANASSYTLEHARNAAFTDGATTVSGLIESEFTFIDPLSDGLVYWHVKSIGSESAFSPADSFRVVTDLADPQGVSLHIISPDSGAFVAIGDSVSVEVRAFRVLSTLDTVVVGLSSSTSLSSFGDLGYIDTLFTPTGASSVVDTFSAIFEISAGDVETTSSGALLQARVSVSGDGEPLKKLDNTLNLPTIIGSSDLGVVGDEVRFGIDGQRPVHTGAFDSVLVDTGRLQIGVFGTRATPDGPGGQQAVRSFKSGDEIHIKLGVGILRTDFSEVRVHIFDALDVAYQVPDSAFQTVAFTFIDLLNNSGRVSSTFIASPGQFGTPQTPDNVRVKAVAFMVDEAGNLGAATASAVNPEGFEQDIWAVGDTRFPVLIPVRPDSSGDRFTGRVDTSFIFRDTTGALDLARSFDLQPLSFSIDEGTSSTLAIVGTDTASYAGQGPDTLVASTVDSFTVTSAAEGTAVDLSLVAVDSVGNVTRVTLTDVVLDQRAPVPTGLFPSSGLLPEGAPLISEETRHPRFTVAEPLDSVSIRFVQTDDVSPHYVLESLDGRFEPGEVRLTVIDTLADDASYTQQVLIRDLAGNLAITSPDTLVFRRDFENPTPDTFLIVLDTTVSTIDSTIAGTAIWLRLTALDASLGEAAVTYESDSVILRALTNGLPFGDAVFAGIGVTDRGDGSADLDKEGWVAGSRTLILRSDRAIDDLAVLATDTTAASSFTGRLGALTVVPAEFSAYAVQLIEDGEPTDAISGEFTISVTPTDAWGNASTKIFTGDRTDSAAVISGLLDSRISPSDILGSVSVSLGSNFGDVLLPPGPQEVLAGGTSFVGTAPDRSAEGLRVSARTYDAQDDASGLPFRTAGGTSAPVIVHATTIPPAPIPDPLPPDTLVVLDYKGADGKGDEGRYIQAVFPRPFGHDRLSHYRIYREIEVLTGLNAEGALVALDEPFAAFVPWAVIPALPTGDRLVRAIVPSIDNLETRWAVAGEWGGPPRRPSFWRRQHRGMGILCSHGLAPRSTASVRNRSRRLGPRCPADT